jgi:hypothetical protein
VRVLTLRRAGEWIVNLITVVFALYFVLLPTLAWCEAAYNQAEGGRAFVGEVAFDLVMACITPTAAVLVWQWNRRRGRTKADGFRAACWLAVLIGVPVLLLRFLAGMGF